MRAHWLMLFAIVLCFPPRCFAAGKKPSRDASAAVFGPDKVWSIHLTISPEAWEKMQPKRSRGGFGQPANNNNNNNGRPNPADRDSKVRGMFGYDFAYVKADAEIDGQKFKDVGVRYKGNGSYAASGNRLKRPFKIDLDRYNPGQSFHGQKKLTLNCNVMDPTAAHEVLGYAVFRRLDVPAPRTAYAKLTLTIPGKYNREFVGFYTLVESIDKTFLKDRFGSSKGLLLKPEFIGPLDHLGDEWTAYDKNYRPKTPADAKSKRRLIEFTKLIHKADDKTFKADIEKYLDVDEFLRFLAVSVAVVNMDSFIGLTHNYLFYLHPKTNRFVFMPWDLDLAFTPFMGSPDDVADLSIRQPQTRANRLIERLLADEKTFSVYNNHLRNMLATAFSEKIIRKELAVINAAIEPLKKQEKEAEAKRKEENRFRGFGQGNRPTDLAAFAAKRIASIQGQLDGKRKGTVLAGRFGFGPGRFLLRPVLDAADKDKDGKLTRAEVTKGVTAFFFKLDKSHKGELNMEELTEGINDLLPRPPGFGGPGGPRPGGPPGAGQRPADGPRFGPYGPDAFRPPGGGLGGMYARGLMDKAGKDGKVTLERLLAAADKLFSEMDKNKDGKLDDKELPDALGKLMPPFRPPAGGRPAAAPAAGQQPPKREGQR